MKKVCILLLVIVFAGSAYPSFAQQNHQKRDFKLGAPVQPGPKQDPQADPGQPKQAPQAKPAQPQQKPQAKPAQPPQGQQRKPQAKPAQPPQGQQRKPQQPNQPNQPKKRSTDLDGVVMEVSLPATGQKACDLSCILRRNIANQMLEI